ncbi:MAG: DUF1800 domain-containing protein [Anaerolineales bacterium]
MPATRSISRRDFLRLAGLVAAGAAAAGCAPIYARLGGQPEPPLAAPFGATDPAGFALLNRLTFGPRLAERQHLADIGAAAWIEEQLRPEAIDDAPTQWRLRRLETLNLSAADLSDRSDKILDGTDKLTVPAELRQAALLRQVYSRRQLYEVMVEFWTDHFNISVDKGACWLLKTVDDREVIRPHALGRFRDLLWASAHSPAMLVYLDNQANIKGAPNENYAREIMELHTLGLDGGYTQRDVMELARAFTGWGLKDHFFYGRFTFNADQHDPGEKTVLGLTLRPGGLAEAEQVLETLAVHPATAGFIAAKLARRFLGEAAPPEIIARARAAFIRTQGDIAAVLRTILLDGLLAQPTLAAPKFKRPINYVASALRQLNAETDGGPPLHDYLALMGQKHFAWPTPDGYPDRTAPWTGNLIPRWQYALSLARGEMQGTKVALPALSGSPAALADDLSLLLLNQPWPATQRENLLAALRSSGAGDDVLPAILTAGLLASPAFQWR